MRLSDLQDKPEYEFVLNENGGLKEIKVVHKRVANGIVEEAMIVSNVAAGDFLAEKLNSGKILLATLAQGQYVGGQFHASPKSDNTDGLIDVCVLRGMSLIGLGMIIKKYTKGKHLDKRKLPHLEPHLFDKV